MNRELRDLIRQRDTSAGAQERDRSRSSSSARTRESASSTPPRYAQQELQITELVLAEIAELGAPDDSEEELRTRINSVIDRTESTRSLSDDDRRRLAGAVVDELLGYGPIASLMADPNVTDVLVNGAERVYVERFGKLELTRIRFRDDEHVQRMIERLAARVGRRIDRAWPLVDFRLADGSRVNATLPPASIDGPTVSIRRFGQRRLRRVDLLRAGMFDTTVETFLDYCVRERANILISGGTGAGKSTLLSALAESISDDERVITIEDTVELVLDQAHVVRLEARPANIEGEGRISTRDLLTNALRMRPTRIVIGEVRGGEALELLQALNTGHEGGLSTIHANSARDALSRLETAVLMSGVELPSLAIREQISSAIDFVVHVARAASGERRVVQVDELAGLENGTVLTQPIYAVRGAGRLAATGIIPRFVQDRRDLPNSLPLDFFQSIAEGS